MTLTIDDLLSRVEREPNRNDFKIHLARAYSKSGMLCEAARTYKLALTAESRDSLFKELDNVLIEIDRNIGRLLSFLQEDPSRSDVHIRLARFYGAQDKFWLAINSYKEAIKLDYNQATIAEFRTTLNRQNSRTLFFVHIPKTAGTTLNSTLSKSFLPEENISIDKDWSQTLDAFWTYDLEKIKYIHGHIPLSALEEFSSQVDIITLMRDPVELLVSAFMHIKRSPNHALYEKIKSENFTIIDFLDINHPSFSPNLQTSILGRQWNTKAPASLDDKYWRECLDRAKENIIKFNVTVGFQDDIQGFLKNISKKNGLRIDSVVNSHLVTPKNERITLTEEEIGIISDKCCYDIELYQYLKNVRLKNSV